MNNTASKSLDLFISRKGEDKVMGHRLYHFFKQKGLAVFESDRVLLEKGNPDYGEEIDRALYEAKCLIVVVSKVEYLYAEWIKYEWRSFLNKLLNDGFKGKILVLIAPGISIKDIPSGLRNFHTLYYDEENFEALYSYVTGKVSDSIYEPPPPLPIYKRRWFKRTAWISSGILLTWLLVYLYNRQQPFNMTVFLKPNAQQPLHPDYPKFKGGKLWLYIGDKEEFKEVDPGGEVMFKHLGAKYRGKTVALKFVADKWMVTADSITLGNNAQLVLTPDGSMATVKGTVYVKGFPERPIDNAAITIGAGDTVFYTSKNGIFNVRLSPRLQQDSYLLHVTKPGYITEFVKYFPKADYTDIPLTRKLR
jgi:TIR domain